MSYRYKIYIFPSSNYGHTLILRKVENVNVVYLLIYSNILLMRKIISFYMFCNFQLLKYFSVYVHVLISQYDETNPKMSYVGLHYQYLCIRMYILSSQNEILEQSPPQMFNCFLIYCTSTIPLAIRLWYKDLNIFTGHEHCSFQIHKAVSSVLYSFSIKGWVWQRYFDIANIPSAQEIDKRYTTNNGQAKIGKIRSYTQQK